MKGGVCATFVVGGNGGNVAPGGTNNKWMSELRGDVKSFVQCVSDSRMKVSVS